MAGILSTLVVLLISICVIATIVGIPVGIILFIVGATEKEADKKKKMNKIALWFLVGPIVTLLAILSLWGLWSVALHTFTG